MKSELSFWNRLAIVLSGAVVLFYPAYSIISYKNAYEDKMRLLQSNCELGNTMRERDWVYRPGQGFDPPSDDCSIFEAKIENADLANKWMQLTVVTVALCGVFYLLIVLGAKLVGWIRAGG